MAALERADCKSHLLLNGPPQDVCAIESMLARMPQDLKEAPSTQNTRAIFLRYL